MSKFVPTRGKLKAPRTVHILSWVLSLDKNGYIACLHKNCTFMALTLDEMVTHYHLVNCLKQFPFTCEECKLSTDLEEKLILHKVYVHSYIPTRQEKRDLSVFLDVKKEVSSNLKRGWELYLKNKGYLKCLVKPCSVVLDSLEEMEDHYLNICREEYWALLISKCKYCQGKFECGERMSAHVQRHHCNVAEEVRAYKENHPVSELSPEWAQHILTSKQAACPIPHCRFRSNNVVLLEKHYSSCNGKMMSIYKVCPYCHCWLQNEIKLNEHVRCLHKGETVTPRLEKSNDQEEPDDAASSNHLLDKPGTRTYPPIKEEICDDTSSVYSDNSNYHPSYLRPVFHRRKSKPQSIDCDKNDISEVQFSEEMMDLKTLIVEPSVGGTPCLVNPALLESEHDDKRQVKSMCRNIKTKPPLILEPNPDPTPLPTSLEEVASNLQGQATSTPLQIEVDQQEFKVTVNIPQQPPIPASKEDTFPQNIDALYEVLRNDSFKLLKTISKKISFRSDMKKKFDPYDKTLCSLKFSVKKNIRSSSKDGKNDSENSTVETGMCRDGTLLSNEKPGEQVESILEGDLQVDAPAPNITGEDKMKSEISIHHLGLIDERNKNTEDGSYDLDPRDVMKHVSTDESTNLKSPSINDRELLSSDALAQFPDSKGIINGKLKRGSKSLSSLRMGPSNIKSHPSNIKEIELSSKGIVGNKIISKYENELKEDSSLSTSTRAISEKNPFNPEMLNQTKKHIFTRNRNLSESVSYSNNESLKLELTSDPLGTLPQSCSGAEGSCNKKVSQLTSQVEGWTRDGSTRNKSDLVDNFDCQDNLFNSESSNKEKCVTIESLHLFCDEEEDMNDEYEKIPYNMEESTEQVLLEYREKLALQRSKNLVSDPPSEKKLHSPVATSETELPKNEMLIKNTKTTLFIGAIKGNLSKMRNEILCAADNEVLDELSSEETPPFGKPVDKDNDFGLGVAKKRGRSQSLIENFRTKFSKTYSSSMDMKMFSNVGDRSSENPIISVPGLKNCSYSTDTVGINDNKLKKQYGQKRSISSSIEVGSSENDFLMDGDPLNEISGTKKCKTYHQPEAVKETTSIISSVLQWMTTATSSTENDHFIDHKCEPQSSESGSTSIKDSVEKKTEGNIKTTGVQRCENVIFKATNVLNEDISAENLDASKKSSFINTSKLLLESDKAPVLASTNTFSSNDIRQITIGINNISPLATRKKRGRQKKSTSELTSPASSSDIIYNSELGVNAISKEEPPQNSIAPEISNISFPDEGTDCIKSEAAKKMGNIQKIKGSNEFSNPAESSANLPPSEPSMNTYLNLGIPQTSIMSDISKNSFPVATKKRTGIPKKNIPNEFNINASSSDNVPSLEGHMNTCSTLVPVEIGKSLSKDVTNKKRGRPKKCTSNETSPLSTSPDHFLSSKDEVNDFSKDESPQNVIASEIPNTSYTVEGIDITNSAGPKNEGNPNKSFSNDVNQSSTPSNHFSFNETRVDAFLKGDNPLSAIVSEVTSVLSPVNNQLDISTDGLSPILFPVNNFVRDTSKNHAESNIHNSLNPIDCITYEAIPIEQGLTKIDTSNEISQQVTTSGTPPPIKTKRNTFSEEETPQNNIFCEKTNTSNCIEEANVDTTTNLFPVERPSVIVHEKTTFMKRGRSKKSISLSFTDKNISQNSIVPELSNASFLVESALSITPVATKEMRGRPKKRTSSNFSHQDVTNNFPTSEVHPQNNNLSKISNTFPIEVDDSINLKDKPRRRVRPKKSVSNEMSSHAVSSDNSIPSEPHMSTFSNEDNHRKTSLPEVTNSSFLFQVTDEVSPKFTKKKRGRPKKSISNEISSPASSSVNTSLPEAVVNSISKDESPTNIIASEISNISLPVEGTDCITPVVTKKRRGSPKINEFSSPVSCDNLPPSESTLNTFSNEDTSQNSIVPEISKTSVLIEDSESTSQSVVKRKRGRHQRIISNETRSLSESSDRFLLSKAEMNDIATDESLQNTIVSEISNTLFPVKGTDYIAAEATKKMRSRPKTSVSNEFNRPEISSDNLLPSKPPMSTSIEDTPQNSIVPDILNTSVIDEDIKSISQDVSIKKRGRPKKSISNETKSLAASPGHFLPAEAEVNALTTEGPLLNSGASETSNLSIPVEGSDCLAEATKKRRGRPKISISNEFSSPAISSDNLPPSEPSMNTPQNSIVPDLSNTSVIAEDTDISPQEAVQNKRGRPMKSISNKIHSLAESSDNFSPSESVVNAISKDESPPNNINSEISKTSLPTEGTPIVNKKRRGRPKMSVSNEFSSPAISSDNLPLSEPAMNTSNEDTPQNSAVPDLSNTSVIVEYTKSITQDVSIKKRGRPKKSISNETRSLAATHDQFLPSETPKEQPMQNTLFPVESTDCITSESLTESQGRPTVSISSEFNSPAVTNDNLPPSVPLKSFFSYEDSFQTSMEPELSNTSFPVGIIESISQVATKKKRGGPKKSIPNECPIDMNPNSQSDVSKNADIVKVSNTSFPVECAEKIISEAKIKRRRVSKNNACNEFCCMSASSNKVSPSVAQVNGNPKLESRPNTITSEVSNSSFSVGGCDCFMPEALKKPNNNISNQISQPTALSDNFPLSGDLTNTFCNDATPESSIVSEISNSSFSVNCTNRVTPDGKKKRRGRPKRNVSDEFSVSVALSENVPSLTTFSNENTPQNSIVSEEPNTSFLVEHADTVTTEAIKKKRGRPKKTLSNEISHPDASNNNVPSSEAPINTEDTLLDSIVSEIPNSSFPFEGTDSLTREAIKKGSGRPKKSISAEISNPVASSDNIHLSEDNMIGFLKHDASFKTTVTSDTLKKLGISSNASEASNVLDPNLTSCDVVKKRGRPKKRISCEINLSPVPCDNSTPTEFRLKDFSKDDTPQNASAISKNSALPKESVSDDSHHPSILPRAFAPLQDEKLHNITTGEITKKRGRPKKCISNEISDSLASSSILLHKEASFNPYPLKDTPQNSSTEILNISNSVQGIAVTESIVVTKKRGRLKKNISKKRGRPKKVGVAINSNNVIFNDLSLEVPTDKPVLKNKKEGYNPNSGEKGSPQGSVKQEVANACSLDGDDLYDNANDDSYDDVDDDAHDFGIDAFDTSQNSYESSLDKNNTQTAGKLSPTIPSPLLRKREAYKGQRKLRGVSSVVSNLLPSTLAVGSPSSYSTFISDLISQEPNATETSTCDHSCKDIENFDEEVKNSTFTGRGAHFMAKVSFCPEGAGVPSQKKRGRPKVVRKDNTFDNESTANEEDTLDIFKCGMTDKQTVKLLDTGSIEDGLARKDSTDCFTGLGEKSSTLKEPNEIVSPALPKKRGRPRKAEDFPKSCPESVSEKSLENHIEQENSIRPRRQRNRRRSLFLEEFEEDSDEEQPKKRSCQSRNSLDNASHGRRRVQSGRIESWTILEDPDKEVTCAVCEESMTALSYQCDHLKKHNFMAWIIGEEPWPLEDENYMYNVLTRGRKRFPGFVFTCELCNDQRKSAKGYLTHRQHCGKQEATSNHNMSPDLHKNKTLGSDPEDEAPSNLRKLPDILSNSGMLQSSAEKYSFYQQAKEEENKSLTDRQIRRRILSGRIDAVTKLKEPNKQVKCAVCGETMTARDYQKKHLLKHNFIAWLEGEEPLPLDDPECMTNVLQRGKLKYPRFVFTCDICNERKKSSLGFLSHRQFCGRSVEEKQNLLVSCEHCGRVMMPFSLAAHMYQVHRSVVTEEDSGVVEPVRKAASRCMDKMAIFKEALADDNEETHSEDENAWDSERFNSLYDYTFKRPSKNLSTLWKFQEERGENITCSAPQCEFTCTTYLEILEHFKACPSNLTSFSCLRCHYTSKNVEKMEDHVQHCVLLNDQPEDDINDLNVMPYLKSEEGDYPFRIKLNFFKPALNWTKNLMEVNLSKEALFVDFEGGWEKVMAPTRFIPEASTSLPFCYNTSSWSELPLFQGKIQESGKEGVSFIGGPVWGLAWCPTSGPQYLAVGAQPSMETHFQVGSTYNGPGLIQLWSLGNLNNTAGSRLERLELELGLCHEERGCWDLAWCPGGGETSTRLGLLAVATTSGTIPIYPVPKPHTLPLHQTRYYKVKAAVKLELPSSEKWQCSAISWSKKKPHRIIVAGFVNGMIGVWDLTSTSSLLRAIPGSLFAHKVFQAHNSFITGISLSPESEDFLVSSGFDKSLKFWDLRDTGMPVTVSSRGLPTAVDWLRHWMMATTAFDVAYSLSNNTVSLSSLRGYMQQTLPVVASINSTSWDVSCNDWLNAVAACFDNGQVLVYFPVKQHVLLHHKERKKYSKVIMQSSLKEYPREESQPGTSSNPSKPSESSTLYSESCRKYGLNIQTDIKVQPLGANEVLKENTNEGPIDIYPLTSINRVAWNPNMEAFTYLASGSQAGLLHVTKLSFMKREQLIIDSLINPKE